jgi:hypothetical protein
LRREETDWADIEGTSGAGKGRRESDIEQEHRAAAKRHSKTQRGGERRAGYAGVRSREEGSSAGRSMRGEEHQRERRVETVEQQRGGYTKSW